LLRRDIQTNLHLLLHVLGGFLNLLSATLHVLAGAGDGVAAHDGAHGAIKVAAAKNLRIMVISL